MTNIYAYEELLDIEWVFMARNLKKKTTKKKKKQKQNKTKKKKKKKQQQQQKTKDHCRFLCSYK